MEVSDQQLALMRRYREIMPIVDPLVNERKKILSLPYRKEFLVRSSRDIYKEVAYLYFLNNKLLDYVRVIHVYQLIDVYLGNSQRWSTILQINDPLVVILLGYNEFENKRTNEVLNQYLSYRKDDPLLKCLLVFYKGNELLYDTKYGKKANIPVISLPQVDLYRLGRSTSPVATSEQHSHFEF